MRPVRLVAVALLAALGACSDSIAPASIYGTYELQTVDAKPLPSLLLQEGDYTFKATAGSYTLRENGTFASSTTWREDYQGWTHLSTHAFEGTFTLKADTVTFVWPSDGRTWKGTLNGSELAVSDDNLWSYRK